MKNNDDKSETSHLPIDLSGANIDIIREVSKVRSLSSRFFRVTLLGLVVAFVAATQHDEDFEETDPAIFSKTSISEFSLAVAGIKASGTADVVNIIPSSIKLDFRTNANVTALRKANTITEINSVLENSPKLLVTAKIEWLDIDSRPLPDGVDWNRASFKFNKGGRSIPKSSSCKAAPDSYPVSWKGREYTRLTIQNEITGSHFTLHCIYEVNVFDYLELSFLSQNLSINVTSLESIGYSLPNNILQAEGVTVSGNQLVISDQYFGIKSKDFNRFEVLLEPKEANLNSWIAYSGGYKSRLTLLLAMSIVFFLWILLLTELYTCQLMNQVFYVLIGLCYTLSVPITIWAANYVILEHSVEIGLFSGTLLAGAAHYLLLRNTRSSMFLFACSLAILGVLLISENNLLKFTPLLVAAMFSIIIGIILLGRSVDWNSVDPFYAKDKTVIRVVENKK